MDYEKLSTDDQYRILEARLRIYEQKHFDATLNLEVGEATKADAQLPELQKRVDDLEACISHVRERLSKMSKPVEEQDNRERMIMRRTEMEARRQAIAANVKALPGGEND